MIKLLLVLVLSFNLQSQEISCGLHNRTVTCSCWKIKEKQIKEERDKCTLVLDKDKRMDCYSKVSQCRDIKVTDREHVKFGMPYQCQRYCTTAKCKCCVS